MHRGLHSTVIPLTFAQHHSAVHSLRSASARKRSPLQGRVDARGKRARGMIMFNSGCNSSFAKWICLSLALALALFSAAPTRAQVRSEEHTSELQSRQYLVCRLLLEKKRV